MSDWQRIAMAYVLGIMTVPLVFMIVVGIGVGIDTLRKAKP